MGRRMEIYQPEVCASKVIEITKLFNVDAQDVGRVESSNDRE